MKNVMNYGLEYADGINSAAVIKAAMLNNEMSGGIAQMIEVIREGASDADILTLARNIASEFEIITDCSDFETIEI